MTTPSTARMLSRYNAWSNKVMFDAVAALPEGEATKERKSLFKNIVHTLNHNYVIDLIWQAHLEGRDHGSRLVTPYRKPHGGVMFRLAKAFAILLLPLIAAAADSKPSDLVRIEGSEVRMSLVGPVVLLKAQGKAIPIFIDAVVAQSIAGALSGEKFPRPLSHDLMRSILESFEGRVTRVVITLKGATYYADLTVVLRGTTKVFDSRSSDAIALAIHFNAPMLVSRELLEKAGQVLEGEKSKPEGTRL